ncbi:exodeoxyribonuclease VII large subunit [Candidatus Azambacteria bacterium RIFCSPHIGHO2_02_FULL_52_12]|uniref:Exodeoxyribonuclease 7 large subunit n=1 Tax=Candidatus Azambacteria bacterium RIFCSPLOWO2_01_FULL_46_25 TaxID=1797298 RepID=A0A1F5BTY5_9BACT|nr:MAG: exodeoxyribonuclease VII large subunit [Candidatus Azambacteria bacterium RIFCSPHIGHO2_02_FULL_52_12]OGD34028.1 MAG: exodeoxyribonuclease VII large subunit [Candidatus Azambacteria bacterium RIFCSPLOWO2_01_FULL_46_25]OGD36550.1 MAG: exodeoxyribonuclease VII large subunit [Candidatus Azambacteria bacterium RIFCSPHIGHO2_01_FULL_51_74]
MVNFKIFSVSEYTEYLNEALYPLDAVVEGEISEYKVNQQKWVFFKIKDENSVLDCFGVIFKLKFPLEDGMRVRLYGRPKIYPKSGKLSITVDWVEPSGEGALKRAFELLKKELEKEGLFAQGRKRAIPRFPRRIGLITSRESAAYEDFLKILRHRFCGIEIYLYHAQVQGMDAIESITRAFSYFNEQQKELRLDCIALVRGGGAVEDLAAFNSREVAYAIFGSGVPVVSGVGHEPDVTIADFVADVRASTPSNAAELIAPDKQGVLGEIEVMEERFSGAMASLHNDAAQTIADFMVHLDTFIAHKVHALSSAVAAFGFHLKFFQERVIMQKSKIEHFARLIKSMSPHAVLARGYAIVKKKGAVVASVRLLQPKNIISVEMQDGAFQAEVLP